MSDLAVRLEPFSGDTFTSSARLIYEKTSIHMREGKHILVSNRLRKRSWPSSCRATRNITAT